MPTARELTQLLPPILRESAADDAPLGAFLHAMAGLLAPCDATLASLASVFDPRRTPDKFVAMLSSWVDVGPGLGRDTHALRALVATAAELHRRRGTVAGLQLFLQVATASQAVRVHENVSGPEHTRRSFHVRVVAPAALRADESLLRGIIERERPAYVTYELHWEEAPP